MRDFFSSVLQIEVQLSRAFMHLCKARVCVCALGLDAHVITSPFTHRMDIEFTFTPHSFPTRGDGSWREVPGLGVRSLLASGLSLIL